MRVVAFDTETTGLIDNHTIKISKQPEIIEFYGCLFDDESGKVLKEMEMLIKPKQLVSDEIYAITGINNEMLKDCATFSHYSYDMELFLESAETITGHNLSYDMEMIEIEMERIDCGVIMKWPDRKICTVEQTIHMKGIRLSLSNLHDYLFSEKFEGAHRAKQDVQSQVRCYMELKKRGEL